MIRALLTEPADGFVHDQVGRIAVELADGLAVAGEVVRIEVAGDGIVLRGEPMLEAMVTRLRLRRLVELAVHVPLAAVAGRIAGPLQECKRIVRQPALRQGDGQGHSGAHRFCHRATSSQSSAAIRRCPAASRTIKVPAS